CILLDPCDVDWENVSPKLLQVPEVDRVVHRRRVENVDRWVISPTLPLDPIIGKAERTSVAFSNDLQGGGRGTVEALRIECVAVSPMYVGQLLILGKDTENSVKEKVSAIGRWAENRVPSVMPRYKL